MFGALFDPVLNFQRSASRVTIGGLSEYFNRCASAGVSGRGSGVMLFESLLYIVCYSAVIRTIATLKQIDAVYIVVRYHKKFLCN